MSKTDTEEKKVLNEVITFVFFVHKKYSRRFIKLRLNHWCHMDSFNNVFPTFLGLEVVVMLLFMQGQKALGFHQKYLPLCSEDEQRSYAEFTWHDFKNHRITAVCTLHDNLGLHSVAAVFTLHDGSATGGFTLHDFTKGRITDNSVCSANYSQTHTISDKEIKQCHYFHADILVYTSSLNTQ